MPPAGFEPAIPADPPLRPRGLSVLSSYPHAPFSFLSFSFTPCTSSTFPSFGTSYFHISLLSFRISDVCFRQLCTFCVVSVGMRLHNTVPIPGTIGIAFPTALQYRDTRSKRLKKRTWPASHFYPVRRLKIHGPMPHYHHVPSRRCRLSDWFYSITLISDAQYLCMSPSYAAALSSSTDRSQIIVTVLRWVISVVLCK
jgi:hypothetical protein